jgi:Na+/H+ antiporter NhaC
VEPLTAISGALLGGSMFGQPSMISDTTIAATQSLRIKRQVQNQFIYCFPQ